MSADMTDTETPESGLSLGRPRRVAEAPALPPGQNRGSHHTARGTFQNPWPPHPELEERPGGPLAWLWERFRSDLPANPDPDDVPREAPAVASPRAAPTEIRVTLVGHATLLIQVGGLNFLTDPIWSSRAGPFSLVGGPRFAEPGLPMEALPPLDAVLVSHGHYDHLDAATTKRLVARYGPNLPWLCPLGHGSWLRGRGVSRVVELDWWEEVPAAASSGGLRLICLPARHWTLRGLQMNRELWCSWAVVRDSGEPGVLLRVCRDRAAPRPLRGFHLAHRGVRAALVHGRFAHESRRGCPGLRGPGGHRCLRGDALGHVPAHRRRPAGAAETDACGLEGLPPTGAGTTSSGGGRNRRAGRSLTRPRGRAASQPDASSGDPAGRTSRSAEASTSKRKRVPSTGSPSRFT